MARPAADQRDAEAIEPPRRLSAEAVVCSVPFVGGDEALLCGLRSGQPAAIASFCDRFSARVLRLLARLLGSDDELSDLHHEVFVKALQSLHTLRDASRLEGWVNTITINVVRTALNRRTRRRWLSFVPSHKLPEPPTVTATDEQTQALKRTYAVLRQLPREERIAFSLRIIDGMKLTEVAAACGTSLATIKRRLQRAEANFVALAREDPILVEWLEGGARWGAR